MIPAGQLAQCIQQLVEVEHFGQRRCVEVEPISNEKEDQIFGHDQRRFQNRDQFLDAIDVARETSAAYPATKDVLFGQRQRRFETDAVHAAVTGIKSPI